MISRWQASERTALQSHAQSRPTSGCRAHGAAVFSSHLWLAWGMLLAVFLATEVLAEDVPPSDKPPLLYRKVYVPSSAIRDRNSTAVGTEAYLPVKREEFEQLLSDMRVKHLASQSTVESRLVKGIFSASIDDDQVIRGTARLSVVHTGDEPTALPLSPCNLAIEHATWLADPVDDVEDSLPDDEDSVQVGSGETGEIVALVDRSGVMQFDWSLRGEEDSSGELVFGLRLPPTAVNHFTLKLDEALEPVVDNAIVTRGGLAEEDGHRNWLIEIPGNGAADLKIVSAGRVRSAESLVLLRQQSICQIDASTADIAVRLRIDVHDRPVSHLTLDIDNVFNVVDASLETESLTWSEAKLNGRRKVTLVFPEPLSGIGHEVVLRGISDVTLGRPWRVPRVTVHDALWLEGTTILEVPRTVLVDDISMTDCRQTDCGPLNAPRVGEAIQIQDYQPRSIVQVILNARRQEPVAYVGTTVGLGTSTTNLSCVADIIGGAPPRFLVEMDLSAGWRIDTVETRPPELLRESRVFNRGNRQRVVAVNLRSGLAVDSRMQVVIRAHREGLAAGETLSGSELRLGTFRDVTTARSVVVLAADAPSQLQMAGDASLTRLATSDLTDQDTSLIQTAPGAVAFLDDPGADALSVSLSTSPNFEASIQVVSDFRNDQVQREYTIDCVPEASSLDRVRVQFTNSLGRPLNWTWIGDEEVPVEATRADEEESAAESATLGETWRIMLPRPQDKPFKLRAVGVDEFGESTSVPLISVLDAKAQIGTVIIRSTDATAIKIVQRGLKAIPAEVPPPDRYSSARGVFRYEPSLEGRLSVERTDSPPSDLARVWNCQLDTRLYRDGQGVHKALYRIENNGRRSVSLEVPHDVALLKVLLDNQPLVLPQGVLLRQTLTIPLPPGQRFPLLTVQYATSGRRLRPVSYVDAPWLDLDIPQFQRRWVLWTPPGFAASSTTQEDAFSVSQRLLGPLLRPPSQLRLDPFSQRHWQSVFQLDDPLANGQAERSGLLFLQSLEEILDEARSSDAEPNALTWADLFRAAERRTAETDPDPLPLLVDRDRLSAAGIEPESIVELSWINGFPAPKAGAGADSGTQCAAAVLSEAGLILAAHSSWLMVTTDCEAALHDDRRKSGFCDSLWVVGDAWQPRGPSQCSDNLLTTTLAGWVASTEFPHVGWSADRGTLGDAACRGWTAHRIDSVNLRDGDGSLPATSIAMVLQSEFWAAAAWGTFLLAVGLAGWLIRRRVLIGIPATALAGTAALLCPNVLSPIFTSCFLGVLTATLYRFIRPLAARQAQNLPAQTDSKRSIVVLKNAMALLVLAIIWLSVTYANAQQPEASKDEVNPEKVYRVLFPIRLAEGAEDGPFTPEGPYVHVPIEFLSLLRRETTDSGVAARVWMIDDAMYRVVFEWDIAKEHLLVKELVAEYQLHVYRSGSRVSLPFVQEQVYLLPNRAQLDGEPASVAWEPDGVGLSVECPDSGKLQLRLAFRPRLHSSEGLTGFDVGIPPVATARMLQQMPADAIDVQCPSALGITRLDEQSGQRIVQLGPTDRLVAEWSDDPSFSTRSSGIEVDQLMWMHIRPGAVVLNTKFLVTCLSGQVRELALSADPRLRLLPPAEDGPVVERHVHEDPSQSIHLQLRSPVSQKSLFDVDFVLSEASGIGVVRVPRIEAIADRTNRRWLGVSIDPSLQFDAPSDESERYVDPLAFAAAWGQDQPPPQAAVSLLNGDWDFSVAARPRESKLSAAVQMDVSCGLKNAELRFAAEIEPADSAGFQYRLAVPGAMEVKAVSILDDGDEQVARWSRGRSRDLVVRVKKPISQKHRLTVEATMPINAEAAFALPRIVLQDADLLSEEIRLYRRPQVRIEDVKARGYSDASEDLIGQYTLGAGRLCSTVHLVPDQVDTPSIRFKVTPNEPDTESTLLTFLRRRKDLWRAEALYELRIQSGVIDALRFDIPAEWTGPFEMDIEADQEIIGIPDQDRRYLLLRPRQALTETTRLWIRGDLSSRPGERVRAPDIVPLDVNPVERYLIAPTAIDQQAVTWETTGLHYTELPVDFADQKEEGEEIYLAYQPRFQATINDIEQEPGVASVDLADIHIDCERDKIITGSATFDVQPAGQVSCDILLPSSCRLLHVAVDGLPAMLQRKGPATWQVQFGPRQLALQLQILYRGELVQGDDSERPRSLPAPVLPGLSVRKTLWTVQVPRHERPTLAASGTPVDAWQQEVIRFNESAQRIESASEVLAEIDPRVAQSWYLTWVRRASASRGKIRFWAAKCEDFDAERAAEADALEERYQAILTRLDEAGLVARTELQSAMVCRSSDVWNIALGTPGSPPLRLVTEGQIAVKLVQQVGEDIADHSQWSAVAIVLSLALVAALVLPFPVSHTWRSHALLLCAITAGAVWWYWFEFSFLGLALACVGIVAWTICRFSRIRAPFPAFRLGTK